MDLLMRRREMMLAAAGEPVIPTVTLPVGGTPWSTMFAIASPNVVYVNTSNWSTAYWNLRSRTRTDVVDDESTPWFTIPANSTVKIVARNIQKKAGESANLKLGMYARAPGATGNIIAISSTTITPSEFPKTLTATKTITNETNVGNVFLGTTSSTGKYFTCEVEFWINDQRVF